MTNFQYDLHVRPRPKYYVLPNNDDRNFLPRYLYNCRL